MLKMLCALKRACVVLVVVILPALNSDASSVIYQFEPVFGSPFPGGQTPQIQASFEDVNPGTVQLTLTALGLTSGEFLSDLYFNFDPADPVNRMHFKRLDGPRGLASPQISTGANAFETEDGYYDIHFDFNKTVGGTFSGNNSLTYLIAEPGLNAFDFAFLDSIGNGTDANGQFYALARIQGTCSNTEWLGAIPVQPVPEPGSLGFLALAVISSWWGARWHLKRRQLFAPAYTGQEVWFQLKRPVDADGKIDLPS